MRIAKIEASVSKVSSDDEDDMLYECSELAVWTVSGIRSYAVQLVNEKRKGFGKYRQYLPKNVFPVWDYKNGPQQISVNLEHDFTTYTWEFRKQLIEADQAYYTHIHTTNPKATGGTHWVENHADAWSLKMCNSTQMHEWFYLKRS